MVRKHVLSLKPTLHCLLLVSFVPMYINLSNEHDLKDVYDRSDSLILCMACDLTQTGFFNLSTLCYILIHQYMSNIKHERL